MSIDEYFQSVPFQYDVRCQAWRSGTYHILQVSWFGATDSFLPLKMAKRNKRGGQEKRREGEGEEKRKMMERTEKGEKEEGEEEKNTDFLGSVAWHFSRAPLVCFVSSTVQIGRGRVLLETSHSNSGAKMFYDVCIILC